ncbi:hypothetical protein L9F63_022713, partial [Diploptera punctata]
MACSNVNVPLDVRPMKFLCSSVYEFCVWTPHGLQSCERSARRVSCEVALFISVRSLLYEICCTKSSYVLLVAVLSYTKSAHDNLPLDVYVNVPLDVYPCTKSAVLSCTKSAVLSFLCSSVYEFCVWTPHGMQSNERSARCMFSCVHQCTKSAFGLVMTCSQMNVRLDVYEFCVWTPHGMQSNERSARCQMNVPLDVPVFTSVRILLYEFCCTKSSYVMLMACNHVNVPIDGILHVIRSLHMDCAWHAVMSTFLSMSCELFARVYEVCIWTPNSMQSCERSSVSCEAPVLISGLSLHVVSSWHAVCMKSACGLIMAVLSLCMDSSRDSTNSCVHQLYECTKSSYVYEDVCIWTPNVMQSCERSSRC